MHLRPTLLAALAAAGALLAVGAPAATATPSTPDTAQGATYLVGRLVDGTHLEFPGGGGTDYGATADVAFALAAAGGHDTTLVDVVDFLRAHVADYADPAGTLPSFPGPYGGAAAKLALLAEVTGQDPHAFGGFDLLRTLQDHVCTAATSDGACSAPGDFYQAYSGVSQALGVLALSRANATVPAAALTRLGQLQCSDGGFSSTLFTPGDPCTSDVDTTGFAVQALLPAGRSAEAADGVNYLKGAQLSDGGWPGSSGTSSNSAALAIQALVAAGGNDTPVANGEAFLAGLQNTDGGFGISTSSAASDTRATSQAVLASAHATLTSLAHAITLPSPTPSSSAPAPSSSAPASSGAGSTTVTSASVPVVPSSSAVIAATGARSGGLLVWAAVLLLVGCALVYAGRRRQVARHR